jgi:hypothetical protein
LIPKNAWGRCTGSCGNFVDHGNVNTLGQIFETIPDREFHSAVDIMEVFEPTVL